MKYINTFKTHASYEEKLNGGGVDISLPNVSYCEDVKDVHYNPYNTVEFYVGEITSPQTVSIYTDGTNHLDVQVSEGNKWYSYVLPKDKGLFRIVGNSVKNVVVKADIKSYGTIIPRSTVEASFKGSNTINVTNMYNMFGNCIGLTSLDLSGWNTSKVISMNDMFCYCSGLTSLDVSNFNTSNVTDMDGMFSGCFGLTSLDVSNFDTSNVTSTSYMFSNCRSLTSLDLNGWNMSSVTDMRSMFVVCSSLTSLDLSGWNTSKVTNIRSMFYDCIGLTSLDLSGWNTSKVTDMSYMFKNCSGLTSLDLSGWNTSKVTDMSDMSDMFSGCNALKTIRMIGCSVDTINKIKAQLTTDGITGFTIVTEKK